MDEVARLSITDPNSKVRTSPRTLERPMAFSLIVVFYRTKPAERRRLFGSTGFFPGDTERPSGGIAGFWRTTAIQGGAERTVKHKWSNTNEWKE